jgi:hypothetical protein
MNKKAFTILLLMTLFVTTFAVIVKPAHAVVSRPVHFLLPWPWDSLADAINFGGLGPGDHVHILAGHFEALLAPLVIGIPNLFIYGAPTGVTPSIDLAGQTISIAAPNVFIYGLDFWDGTGMSLLCIDLTPAASGCTIRNCTIRGSLVLGSIGIMTTNSANNLIACNTIRGWDIAIDVFGPGSNNNLIKLNDIDNSLLPPTSVGVVVHGGAGAGAPNRVCWNNIMGIPCPPFSGWGRELWDPMPGNPPNLFDDIGLAPYSFGKGNYESSWAIPPPYPVLGPGLNGWFDRVPLVAPISPLLGDVNVDGKVDIFDALLLANAYGQSWCSARWDTRVDLKPDSTIDIYDAIKLAGNFGKSY